MGNNRNQGFGALAALQTNATSTDEAADTATVQKEPEKTLNDRDVQTWSTEELEAYIVGIEGVEQYHSTVVKAITEHLIRDTKLSAAWTVQEVQDFLSQGITPAKTSKDAWVNDVTRSKRREHEWTTQELESWALGEIEPEGTTTASGLALELKRRLNLKVQTSDVTEILKNYKYVSSVASEKPTVALAATTPVTQEKVVSVSSAPTYQGVNAMSQSYIENSLKRFAEVMKPGRSVTPVVGGEAQKLLSEVLNYATRLEDPAESRAALTYLIEYFRANRADGQLFEDTYAFRNIDDMKATVKQQKAHADLLSLFLAYADPLVELRSQTDIGSLIKGVPTQYQSRVYEFFSKMA